METKELKMETKINVFHEGNKITFVNYPFGPNIYGVVGKEILDDNLAVPTGDHTASLLHTLYCNPNPYCTPEFDDIRQIIFEIGIEPVILASCVWIVMM